MGVGTDDLIIIYRRFVRLRPFTAIAFPPQEDRQESETRKYHPSYIFFPHPHMSRFIPSDIE
jgi:hypothetical protein